jgi:hypothetical protein
MNNINYRIDKAITGLKILLQAENEYKLAKAFEVKKKMLLKETNNSKKITELKKNIKKAEYETELKKKEVINIAKDFLYKYKKISKKTLKLNGGEGNVIPIIDYVTTPNDTYKGIKSTINEDGTLNFTYIQEIYNEMPKLLEEYNEIKILYYPDEYPNKYAEIKANIEAKIKAEIEAKIEAKIKDEITELDTKIQRMKALNPEIENFDAKIENLYVELNAEIEKINAKLDAEIEKIDTKLDAKITELDTKIKSDEFYEKLNAEIEKIDANPDKTDLDTKFSIVHKHLLNIYKKIYIAFYIIEESKEVKEAKEAKGGFYKKNTKKAKKLKGGVVNIDNIKSLLRKTQNLININLQVDRSSTGVHHSSNPSVATMNRYLDNVKENIQKILLTIKENIIGINIELKHIQIELEMKNKILKSNNEELKHNQETLEQNKSAFEIKQKKYEIARDNKTSATISAFNQAVKDRHSSNLEISNTTLLIKNNQKIIRDLELDVKKLSKIEEELRSALEKSFIQQQKYKEIKIEIDKEEIQ